MRNIDPNNPALKEGRSIFWVKQLKAPHEVKRLLQPASMNAKLGAGKTVITKGKWKGMPLYQLTLEERKTCPITCQQWNTCYGNNMPFGNRIDHDDQGFYTALLGELGALSSHHLGGFVVRLHVLGDFFAVSYVKFWKRMLAKHAALRIFGYTHRLKGSAIGKHIDALNDNDRCWIRWSDAGGEMSANVSGEGIPCPQQTGKTQSCLTCALCWSTPKPIQFLPH